MTGWAGLNHQKHQWQHAAHGGSGVCGWHSGAERCRVLYLQPRFTSRGVTRVLFFISAVFDISLTSFSTNWTEGSPVRVVLGLVRCLPRLYCSTFTGAFQRGACSVVVAVFLGCKWKQQNFNM